MSASGNKKKRVVKSEKAHVGKKIIKSYLDRKDAFWRTYWVAASLLVVLSIGLYLPSLSYEFVLDDKIVYSENNYVKEGLSGIGKILGTETFQGYFGEQKDLVVGARYRPLSLVTFAVEYHFFGLNPKVGHFGNIVFYALSILLLLRVLSLMFPLKEKQAWYFAIPFWASLLFVLHPLHVEVVANIKGRDEIMTMMGAFGALYFSLRYLDSHKKWMLALASISYFLGLLSKENAITFLAVIPATLYFFTKADGRKQIEVFLPLLMVTILYLIIRYQVIGYFLSSGKEITALMNNPFVEMNYSERLATITYTLGLYLKLLFFPHPLTHDYYPYHIPIMNWTKPGTLLSFALYLGLVWVAIKGFRQKALPSYLIIFYLATLSIVSNLAFPVGTFMNERFVFISSIAFCIFMPWLAFDKLGGVLKDKPQNVQMLPGLLIMLPFVLGFTYKTIDRLPAWENGFALNSAAIEVSKNSARANVFMGTAYFNKYREAEDPEEKKRLLDLSEPFIDKALEIHPPYGDALTMKSGIAAERFRADGQFEPLLEGLYMLGQYRPNHTFFNQYMDYLGKQRHRDQRMEQFYIDLAYRWHFQEQNNPDIALIVLSKGLSYQPNSSLMNLAAGKILESKGDNQRAQEYFNKAMSTNPSVTLD